MLRYALWFCCFTIPVLSDSQIAVKSSQQIGFDLIHVLDDKEQNLCFSPYNISSALSMTFEGARGDTQQEMKRTLGFPSDAESISASFADLSQSFLSQNVLIANSLWIQKEMQILPEFSVAMDKYYNGEFHKVDFQGQIEMVRANINHWIAQATKNKISDLIAPGVLSQATRMVLASAIYLKAGWAFPFLEKQTVKQPFYGLDGGAQTVPMMTHIEEYFYFEDNWVRIIQLPYRESRLALLCVLPVTSLEKVEEKLSPKIFNQWVTSLNQEKIRLYFPKFKISSSLSLEDSLSRLGMELAFSRQADFSGINGNKDLQISHIVHKAFIAADEAGTEAAAATAVIMNLKMPLNEKEPKIVKVDHPFLYFIYDKDSKAILFMGRVVNPLE